VTLPASALNALRNIPPAVLTPEPETSKAKNKLASQLVAPPNNEEKAACMPAIAAANNVSASVA
jgi:hypothetical protein